MASLSRLDGRKRLIKTKTRPIPARGVPALNPRHAEDEKDTLKGDPDERDRCARRATNTVIRVSLFKRSLSKAAVSENPRRTGVVRRGFERELQQPDWM